MHVNFRDYIFKLPSIVKLELNIKMNEDGRSYHNVHHVNDMLSKMDLYLFNNHQEKVVFYLTILFHDAHYIVGDKDNELKSAEFFKKLIIDYTKLDNHSIQMVYDLILATQYGDYTNNDLGDRVLNKLFRFFKELDHNGYYSDYSVFEQNGKNILKEAINAGFERNAVIQNMIAFNKKLLSINLFENAYLEKIKEKNILKWLSLHDK